MKRITIIAALAATMLSMTSCHNDVKRCMKAYDAAVRLSENPSAKVNGYQSAEEAEQVFRAYYNHISEANRANVRRSVDNYKRSRAARAERRAENNRECDAMLNK